MLEIFSAHKKYTTWRKLWVALARAEKNLGLPITDKQIKQLEQHIETISYERVTEIENLTHHDVMAHLQAYGEDCPAAKGILHLGATSAFLTDNTDLIQMNEGLKLLIGRSIALINILTRLASEYAGLATVGYTHFQPAQPTTVGKRICLWLLDFLIDTQDLIDRFDDLHFLGVKGATGSQSSFMILFNHDAKKVQALDELVAKELGFKKIFTIAGQTYTRKQDTRILSALSSFASSAHKCATDLRLLSHLGEMKEGRGKKQVGSSAMPHKQNPIYSERICSLSRFLISLAQNPCYTHATQWLERTLDDSAGRRIYIPEAFLTADAIYCLLIKIFSEIQIDPQKIEYHLQKHGQSLSLENILMHAVKEGKDRQEIHEKLRQDPNNASHLGFSKEELEQFSQIELGRTIEQVNLFLEHTVAPFLERNSGLSSPI